MHLSDPVHYQVVSLNSPSTQDLLVSVLLAISGHVHLHLIKIFAFIYVHDITKTCRRERRKETSSIILETLPMASFAEKAIILLVCMSKELPNRRLPVYTNCVVAIILIMCGSLPQILSINEVVTWVIIATGISKIDVWVGLSLNPPC